MKKNIIKTITGAALLISATGCLEKKEDAQAEFDHRAVLVEAIDNQADGIVEALNKVIISGKFVQNIGGDNPPQPISLSQDNNLSKAINYLLSNQTKSDDSLVYKPDSRLCSEIIAQNDPAPCMQLFENVRLTQTPINESEGSVLVSVGAAMPFTIYYNKNVVSVAMEASQIVNVLKQISDIDVQNGHEGFEEKLPTTHEGTAQITLSRFLSVNFIKVDITSNINLSGEKNNGQKFMVKANASQDLLKVTFDTMLEIASAQVNIPMVNVIFTGFDHDEAAHQVEVWFPGASGSINLDNSLEQVTLDTIKLASDSAYMKVDDQPALTLTTTSELNVAVNTYQGGDASIKFSSAVAAQVYVSTNPMMDGSGWLDAQIDAGTELYFSDSAHQAKVTSGAASLTGYEDFAGSLQVQAGQCLEKQQDQGEILSIVPCQF